MQPLSSMGFPQEPYPATPAGPAKAPPTPPKSAAADQVALGRSTSAPQQMPRGQLSSGLALGGPRPGLSLQGLSQASALGAMTTRTQADTVGPGLLPAGLSLAWLELLDDLFGADDGIRKGKWDATPTPDGWQVPRNPNHTPVKPRYHHEVAEADTPLRVVSNLVGRLRSLRLQWPQTKADPAFAAQKAVLHDLLTRLPADVSLHLTAEGRAHEVVDEFLQNWDFPNPERVQVHRLQLASSAERLCTPLTMWARDGALLMADPQGEPVLLLPSSFRGDGQVDPDLNRLVVQSSGVAPALLEKTLPDLKVRRSRLTFEGGDVIAGQSAVLVGGATLARNMKELRVTAQEAEKLLVEQLGLPVIVIDPQPDFHLDLGFTFLDDQTIAVADPRSTAERAAEMADAQIQKMVQATSDKQLAQKYDQGVARLQQLGYRIERLPNLGGLGLLTPYLTYNNVLMENFEDGGESCKRVYMPTYGISPFDEQARQVYQRHGYQVIDMPSARFSTKLWGAIRCATGELRVSV